MNRSSPTMMTRRQALELLSLTAGVCAAPLSASAQGVTFPRGAIIRTLFKDMAPEELAGGATSFHEHLSLPADFNARFSAATAATRAANGAPVKPRHPRQEQRQHRAHAPADRRPLPGRIPCATSTS